MTLTSMRAAVDECNAVRQEALKVSTYFRDVARENSKLAEALAEAYNAWISIVLDADTDEGEYIRIEACLDKALAEWREGRR